MEISTGNTQWGSRFHAPSRYDSVQAAVVFAAKNTTGKLHGKYDAELGVTAHHAFVGFVHFFQGIFLDHGANAGQRSKLHGVFRVCRRTGRPALQALIPEDKADWRDFDVSRASA